jgi:hypothetical protein
VFTRHCLLGIVGTAAQDAGTPVAIRSRSARFSRAGDRIERRATQGRGLRRGVVVGAGVSLWASKFVATLLYGLEPRDPIALVGAALVLGTVGAAAGWLPAYRASHIDPAEVLRES